jgi:hypothetical protein
MVSVKLFLLAVTFSLLMPQLVQAQSNTNVPTSDAVTAQGNYTPAQAQILRMFFSAVYGINNPELLTEFTGSSSEFAKYDPLVTMIQGFRSGSQNQVMEGIRDLNSPFLDSNSQE